MSIKRKTFAIISHPDAGKTTLTEQLLFESGAINIAGSIKAKKTQRHATSDWMEMEKQRGISVTTSVMQFTFQNSILNLLDTPGHADFSEDTYRTLTAVDSAIMVIDAAKGVEPRTKKLFEICCQRKIPVVTFINKIDRNGLEPLDLLDNIEKNLNISAIPKNWPIGTGRLFLGLIGEHECPCSPDQAQYQLANSDFELAKSLSNAIDQEYLDGASTPVFFGSALKKIGITDLLTYLSQTAPSPSVASTKTRTVSADEEKLTGFIFKIQANMNPKHRDRLAFMRICSGTFRKGMQVTQVRTGKKTNLNQAVLFLSSERSLTDSAQSGDILGIYNHGGIQIGDTFTEGEPLEFIGIPSFAPEIFRIITIKNPLKQKNLQKGLTELAEEGAIQVFRPLAYQSTLIGAVGHLQFDVVAHRLLYEYQVDCQFQQASSQSVRWLDSECDNALEAIQSQYPTHLARDSFGRLVYLVPNMAHLRLMQEKFPDLYFHQTRE
ncbi:MAG: peptide chain release factor 3 [Legionellales bacterium]|nr:peptide chain release factor 3 [Legionellales bacterium]